MRNVKRTALKGGVGHLPYGTFASSGLFLGEGRCTRMCVCVPRKPKVFCTKGVARSDGRAKRLQYESEISFEMMLRWGSLNMGQNQTYDPLGWGPLDEVDMCHGPNTVLELGRASHGSPPT